MDQETTGIPGAVNSWRRGRVYTHSRPGQNMVIPANHSRPHPGPGAGEGVLFPAPASVKSYPRSFTVMDTFLNTSYY